MTAIRRRVGELLALLLLPSALLALSACGPTKSSATGVPKGPARSASAPVPPASPASVTPPPADCSDNPAPTNVASPDGSALQVTLLRQSAPGDSWDIALPAATTNRFPELLKEGPLPDFGPIFERAYDEGGAFSYGGGLIALSIRTSAPDQVVIYDIRPVNTRRVCLPAGLLVTYGSEGGDFIEMNYNLDAARPVAHDRNADGVVTADLYFDAHTIPVAPGDDVQIEMELDAAKWAYGFDIGIDYTLDGQKFTQVVSRPGGAFHVSASLCPRRPQRESLSDADVRRLQGLRFQQVRQRGEAASGAFVVTAVDPDGYARDCQSW